jgi:very-short-patch-repair endonuclease
MISKEILEDYYIQKRFTLKQIGNLLNVSDATVLRWMQKYNISTRSKSEANKGKPKSEEHKKKLKVSSFVRWSRKEEHEKTSKSVKKTMADPVFRVNFLEAQRNRKPPRPHKKNWSDTSREKIGGPRREKTYEEFYGMKKASEIKRKQSKSREGKKLGPHSEKTKEQISITKRSQHRKYTEEEKNLRRIRSKQYWANLENRKMQSNKLKGKPKSKETKEKMSKSALLCIQNNPGPFKDTKPELKMKEILNELNISFKHQFRVEGINHNFDFHIPNTNILIEVDGDYFHGNSKKFSKLNWRQEKIRQKDKENEELATKFGFILLRFWEDDIINNTEEVKMKLINFIGGEK